MSADNGVYVLYTESPKGPEYRVSYTQAIDNIYGLYNKEINKYEGNLEMIKATFQDSPVFYTLNEALDKAEEIAYDTEYLEHGICVINDFKDYGYIFE